MSHQPQLLVASKPRADFAPRPFRCTRSGWGVAAAWVRAFGELDVAAAPQLERALAEVESTATLIVLDLRELEFIDSAGVHVIVDASIRARLEGRRLIVAADPHVSAIFALTGTSEAVEFLALDPADVPASTPLHLVLAEAGAS